ncbi:MAG: carbohydrate ABC transporter permease [Chloroflexota bacterium]|nr:carbohydrate ABC transporter permease [Chloroflexota bacterium]
MTASPVRRVVVYGSAVLLAVWTIIPVYWLANMALMYHEELISIPAHLYPHQVTLSNFVRMFGLPAAGPNGETLVAIGQAFLVRKGWLNSLIVSAAVTIITLAISLPCAYALGRLRYRGRGALLFAIVSTRAYPPVAVLVPFSYLFLLVGLQGTVVGLVIIYLTIAVPLITWIMSGFFASLPRNLERAARVDGLTRWQAFSRIMVPVAMPGVAACAVIAFLTSWNEFTFSLILNAGSSAQTFPPALSSMFFQISFANEMAAATLLGIIPPAVLALIFQARIKRLNIADPMA